MSDRELTRLRVMIDLADDRLTVDAAATLMVLGQRQIYRLRQASVCGGWPDRSGVAQTRPAEQPQAWRDLRGHGAEPGARPLHRLRPHTGGEKVDGTSRSANRR
jgi:hypothetical protein